MATWKLVAKDVKYTVQLPAEVKFTADAYECSECHNRTNNRDRLPNVCPWCGRKNIKGEQIRMF